MLEFIVKPLRVKIANRKKGTELKFVDQTVNTYLSDTRIQE